MGDLPPMDNSPGVKSMFSFLLNSSGEPWIIANFGDITKFRLFQAPLITEFSSPLRVNQGVDKPLIN